MIFRHELRSAPGMDFSWEIAHHSGDRRIGYKTVQGEELFISLFLPDEYEKRQDWPLLVLIHGGGWMDRRIFLDQDGWNGDYQGYIARHFAKRGWLCASVEYRLARDKGQSAHYELMDTVDDCVDAVKYLRDHQKEMGFDENRTAVTGESAGGHLAGMLAAWGAPDFFKTAVLVNPVTDFSDPRWKAYVAESSAQPLLKDRSMAEKIACLSPTSYLSEKTCPTLLLHGEADQAVAPFHSVKYHDILQQAGVETQLHLMEGTDHAFLLADYMNELGRSLNAAAIGISVMETWLDRF